MIMVYHSKPWLRRFVVLAKLPSSIHVPVDRNVYIARDAILSNGVVGFAAVM
jgi:hypothetical protein